MYLLHAQLVGVAPFGDLHIPFVNSQGEPNHVTIVHGGGGVGKTALLQVVASTRPGHASTLLHRNISGAQHPPHAICQWRLGQDDAERPHPLMIVTPGARPPGDDDLSSFRRREQALFDRQAKERGGFMFLSISGARWFSRQPLTLHAPTRTVGYYDVRSSASFDDASHSDLTRDTKQSLAYAGIASALYPSTQRARNRWRETSETPHDTRLLGTVMREMVDTIVQLVGFRYEGVDPVSIEPVFSMEAGMTTFTFDRLPNRARHLVSFAALSVRALWAAYPGQDPRETEGIVAIDDIDLHQEPAIAARSIEVLRTSLPRVQWILTTGSATIAASVPDQEVVALRRVSASDHVRVFVGQQARTH